MRLFFYSWPLFFLFGCGQNDLYRSTLRSADSLNGAVNFVLKELAEPDSAELSKYQRTSGYYNQFIVQNITDTVNRVQADALQMFMNAGKALDHFEADRKEIMKQGAELSRQLELLSQDLEKKNMPATEGRVYYENEKKTAEVLIAGAQSAKKNVDLAIQNLKNSVRVVEQVIRSRNHGNLPTIVKDSTAFN